jgi:hypothetical protein
MRVIERVALARVRSTTSLVVERPCELLIGSLFERARRSAVVFHLCFL